MMNQISSTGTSGTSSTAGSAAAAALMRFGGLGATATPLLADKPGEEPIREEDGQLSLDVAERMLKWHAEAIGRCVELSASADV
jgi:exocyst complex component 5